MLYWVDHYIIYTTIYRSDLAGQSKAVFLPGGAHNSVDILIDGGYLFFSFWRNKAIERVSLNDSSDRITVINITDTRPNSFAVFSLDVWHTQRSTQCSARNGLGDCSNVCIPVADKYYCACDNATTLKGNGRTCENAILCPDSIPNGEISSTCDRHKFEQCEFKCNPGRYSDVEEITCIIGEWNDSDPCNKECEQGTWGDQCAKTCACDFETTLLCDTSTGHCDCKAGWAGTNCSFDINECTTQNTVCPSYSDCVNVEGSFICICRTGYLKTTSGNCEECEQGAWGYQCAQICSCDFENTLECSSTTGQCDCKAGWAGENCTFDIDECVTGHATCQSYSDCINIKGSFVCICQTGYFKTASGMCEECTGNTFGENCSGTCECTAKHSVHSDQSCDRFNGDCKCLATWTGEKCDDDVDECQINTHGCNVSEHLICQNKPGGFDCICKDCFPPGLNATAEEKNYLGMIIGMSVGIPLGIIAVTIVFYTLRLSRLKRTREPEQADERREDDNYYLHPQSSNDNSPYSTIPEQYASIHETSITDAHPTLPKPVQEAVSGPENEEI